MIVHRLSVVTTTLVYQKRCQDPFSLRKRVLTPFLMTPFLMQFARLFVVTIVSVFIVGHGCHRGEHDDEPTLLVTTDR
jgi:hypothetical protein